MGKEQGYGLVLDGFALPGLSFADTPLWRASLYSWPWLLNSVCINVSVYVNGHIHSFCYILYFEIASNF